MSLKTVLQSVGSSLKKSGKSVVKTAKNKLSREAGKRMILEDLGGRGVKARINRNILDELRKKGVSRKDAIAIKRNTMNADIGNARIKADVRDKAWRVASSVNRHKGKIAIGATVAAGGAYAKKKHDDSTVKGKIRNTGKTIRKSYNKTTDSISRTGSKIKKSISNIGSSRGKKQKRQVKEITKIRYS